MKYHSPITNIPQSERHRGRCSPRPRRGALQRSAFTLVEMLIAMALTLILVYAIAQFYAIVGDSVKDGRAMIELNQQLRAAVQRLKSDLDQITVPVVPWADEGGAAGYFEYREGPASDTDINGNGKPDREFEPVIFSPPGLPSVSDLLGDIDDWLGLTIRSSGVPFTGQVVQVVPATGLLLLPNGTQPVKSGGSLGANEPTSLSATSPYAEVAWWTSFSDTDSDGGWDYSEPRLLHRRQLLIRPDLNGLHPGDNLSDSANIPWAAKPYFCRIPVPPNAAKPEYIYVYDLYQYCDVSMRPIGFDITNSYLYFAANSLSDLCKRENRFMHQWPNQTISINVATSFPYAVDLLPNASGNLQPNIAVANTLPRHNIFNESTQYRWVLFDGGRRGEDVIASNLLAFDIRVYDPNAVLRPDVPLGGGTPTTVLAPGDPGYTYAIANNYQNAHAPYSLVGSPNYPGMGTGAYVDLGYGAKLQAMLPLLPNPHKVPVTDVRGVLYGGVHPLTCPTLSIMPSAVSSAPPVSYYADYPALPPIFFMSNLNGNANAQLKYWNILGFTYDTWTVAYERDGINQDGNLEYFLLNGNSSGTGDFDPTPPNLPLIDEGTDGLDNLENVPGIGLTYRNGIDDVQERETVPPYSQPLRGIQVRIRIYEPGTRQMRQATVESDFISE